MAGSRAKNEPFSIERAFRLGNLDRFSKPS
jgi:hypothetical protein